MRQLHNCALIRYEGGHLYIDRAAGHQRREVYIELGGVADADTAEGLGRRILANGADARLSDATEGTVITDAQVPTAGYSVGDLMAGKRLRAYTASLTGEGLASVVPELDDPWDVEAAALARTIKRSGAGIASEYARPSITRQTTGKSTDTEPPEFSLDGPIVKTYSPIWTAGRPWWCCVLHAKLAVPGLTPTVVAVGRVVAGTAILVATATIAGGGTLAIARVNQGWRTDDELIVGVAAAGAGAQKLTVTLRGTMV